MIMVSGTAAYFGKVLLVSQFLTGLSTDLGRPIRLDKLFKNEMIFVGGAKESPSDLLKDIASALHASVREGKDGSTVERTAADLKALHESQERSRAGWMRSRVSDVATYRRRALNGTTFQVAYSSALAAQDKLVTDAGNGALTERNRIYPGQILPAEELLEGIVARIGVENLAEVGSNEQRVYQDDPVGDDLPLPKM